MMAPDDSGTRVVRGAIVLPEDHSPDEVGDIIVQIEDVSRADAPSVVVGEYRRERVKLEERSLPFAIEMPANSVDARHLYSVRVHVDVTSSGHVKGGDYVTTESYPVLTRGYGEVQEIHVKRV